MKKYFALAFIILAAALGLVFSAASTAQIGHKPAERQRASFVSANVVISQIFGGGGLTNAPYNHDFVELFNRGTSPVNLSNWSVQYASASGILDAIPSSFYVSAPLTLLPLARKCMTHCCPLLQRALSPGCAIGRSRSR